MNSFITYVQSHPFIVALGIVGSICSIWGVMKLSQSRKNKLSGVKIKGDYTGGDKGSTSDSDVVNDLKDTEIEGDYTGGNDNSK